MKKIALLLALMMMFSACGSKAPAASSDAGASQPAASASQPAQSEQEHVLLKLNHVQSNTDPAHAAFEELAKNVMERSNGTLEIQVYANSELGSNKDNLEQIKNGANIIANADPALMADYVPDYSVMNGPFLFKSNDDLQKLYNSAWHDGIEEKCSEQGIKVLAMNWYFGERHIISKKPVQTPADLKGMKVRVPSATMWAETMKAMGAVPTTLQWSEVYSGLEQGVVEAAEAPLSTIYTSKLQEAAKNVSLTGHFTGIIGLEMSQQIWDSLSDEHKTILTEEVAKQGEKYSAGVIADEESWKQKLIDEGVTVHEVDRAPFAEAAKAAYDKFPEWTPGLYETVQEALK